MKTHLHRFLVNKRNMFFLFSFFFLPATTTTTTRIIHSTSEKSKSCLFHEGEGKQTGQTGYNRASGYSGNARSKAGEALRYLYWLLEAWQWSTGNSTLPSLPLSFPSTPPPTTVAPRRTNKSFVDPGLVEWPSGDRQEEEEEEEENSDPEEREKQTKGWGGGDEWGGSEDRLLSDTGRACKLIERGGTRESIESTGCASLRKESGRDARYNVAASFLRFKLDSFECLGCFARVTKLIFLRCEI